MAVQLIVNAPLGAAGLQKEGSTMNPMARRMFELVEPIGVIPYSADEPNEAMFALGFTNYWDTYFAGRAAPLGPFRRRWWTRSSTTSLPVRWPPHSEGVGHHHAGGGDRRSPGRVCEGVAADPRRSARHARGRTRADVLLEAATSAPVEGRPLYAALRALPNPDEVVARLFHAASLLREHRGDGHIAALMSEGVGGLEAHVLLALDMDMPAEKFGRIHHLPAAQIAAVVDGMRERGLIGDDGWLSESGRAVKQRVEALTDDLAAKPYESLEPGALDELMATLDPLATELLAAQEF